MSERFWEERACEVCGHVRRVKVTVMLLSEPMPDAESKHQHTFTGRLLFHELWARVCTVCTLKLQGRRHQRAANSCFEKANRLLARRAQKEKEKKS